MPNAYDYVEFNSIADVAACADQVKLAPVKTRLVVCHFVVSLMIQSLQFVLVISKMDILSQALFVLDKLEVPTLIPTLVLAR